MAQTLINSDGLAAGCIVRSKLNTTTAASAVVAKLIAGTGVSIAYTGVDAGTGDVTISSAPNVGTATLNFGSYPGSNTASVSVTGQTAITALSTVEAFIMSLDTTTDHTSNDHAYAGLWLSLTCAASAGVGFTINAESMEFLQGTFKVRWVWR